jgi:hypothetical protein
MEAQILVAQYGGPMMPRDWSICSSLFPEKWYTHRVERGGGNSINANEGAIPRTYYAFSVLNLYNKYLKFHSPIR